MCRKPSHNPKCFVKAGPLIHLKRNSNIRLHFVLGIYKTFVQKGKSNMILRPFCLLLFIAGCYQPLNGIEIFLKNGDRLQGDLLIESDEHITLKHPILGEIEIAKEKLAEWPPPKPKPEPVKLPPTRPSSEPKNPDPELPSVEEPEEEDHSLFKKLPLFVWESPKQLIRALQNMNSKFGFSFSDKESRRDQSDLRIFYNSRWKNGRSEYRLDSDYRYRETDGDVSDDRYSADFRFRRQQTRNLFIQSSTVYKRDPLREINHWVEQGIGGGWKNKVSPAFEYSLGGETSVRWEDLSQNNGSIGGTSVLVTAFQDSVLQITKDYQLLQDANLYLDPEDSENWGYSFDLKLDGKISDGFTVRLGYEYNFQNLVPRNVPKKETLISSSILYTF